ncbi:hypothetical protein NQ318_021597 [Aromia moschata]|uniref:Dolichol-phosphate mannosyltransferase subunit 3 n=1 Tax=Aromia moschata TaxID=1265417 RepID=A0AAV8YIU6_9CUCU|nr:hypothetical protein NQ318_021597 [Aromia moschata]
MTKLFEWLAAFGAVFGIWFILITNKLESSFVKNNYNFVLYSPVLLIILFGEIIDAREDLIKRGINLTKKAS